jgi:hypothetical protein
MAEDELGMSSGRKKVIASSPVAAVAAGLLCVK